MPSFKNNNVVDAIGAGDSFNAGLIFKYIAAASLKECQDFANLMGAINTTAPGGTTAFRDYAQIINTAREIFGYRG
jgi:sugar/nucleoside kinase (ribokinase family)